MQIVKWMLVLLACSSASAAYSEHKVKTSGSVFAIGDLHGDLVATKKTLRLAGAIDEKGKWIGKNIVVVQTGDQIDRGDEDREVLDFLDRLSDEAPKYNSRLIVLNGNHEILNAQTDMRYASKASLESFLDFDILSILKVNQRLSRDNGELNRASAFYPGEPYARLLAKRSFYAIVNDTVFVHGGIFPIDINYGLERLNKEMRMWLLGLNTNQPRLLRSGGPLWRRDFSQETPVSRKNCEILGQVLHTLGVKRMVVGHSIQKEGINAACNGLVWRIDVGMSSAYSNPHPPQILEIARNRVTVHDS